MALTSQLVLPEAMAEADHRNNLTALRWFAACLVLYGHAFVFLGLPEPLFLQWVPWAHRAITFSLPSVVIWWHKAGSATLACRVF